MKAIKDCEWDVEIESSDFRTPSEYRWIANTGDKTGSRLTSFMQPWFSKTIHGAKNHWEKFAKLNGITNWEYK